MGEKRGGSVASALFSVGLIALGVWQLYGRGVHGGAAVVAWGSIAIGVIWLALYVFMRAVPVRTPEGLAELQKTIHSGQHEYRAATPADMRGLDRAFYESVTARLGAAGFRHLGDLVDETSARAIRSMRTVDRIVLSPDGTVTGGICHVKYSGFARLLQILGKLNRNVRMLSLGTELDDGTFVTTGNDGESNTTTELPGVARRHFPADTGPDILVDLHRRHLADVLPAGGSVRPRVFRTLHEVLESQNRLAELNSAHRSSPTFDHVAEFERTAGRPLNAREREIAERLNDRQRRLTPSDNPPPPLGQR